MFIRLWARRRGRHFRGDKLNYLKFWHVSALDRQHRCCSRVIIFSYLQQLSHQGGMNSHISYPMVNGRNDNDTWEVDRPRQPHRHARSRGTATTLGNAPHATKKRSPEINCIVYKWDSYSYLNRVMHVKWRPAVSHTTRAARKYPCMTALN